MSIPKQPRQLMINLMYLVLLALLALNVSAEIFHAFFTMDRGLNESSRVVAHSNEQIVSAIAEQAEAYAQFEPFRDKAYAVQKIAEEFYQAVGQTKSTLITAAGGLAEDGLPKRKTDKDITTRLLVNQGKGDTLENQILNTRKKLLDLIEEEEHRRLLATNIPLNVQAIPADSDKKTWAQFTFQQMPVGAVLPILSKLQNDVKIAETAILNYFLEKTNAVIKTDAFVPVIAADRSYVIRGEEYMGEVFLAAYSTTADNMIIKIDGRDYPVVDGKAVFTSRPSNLGLQRHQVDIELIDPISGETKVFQKPFSYEVGERSVTVSADKMNVMYVGVENPISVSAAGVPSTQVQVEASGVRLERKGNGKYVAIPTTVGDAKISVFGGGLERTVFDYRIKRIPDPVLYLGNKKGGNVKLAEFKAQQGIIPLLENFDFNARCKIVEFELVRVPKNDDVRVIMNQGGGYGSEAKRLIDAAKIGDVYYFNRVKVKCPGDPHGRVLNGMIFNLN